MSLTSERLIEILQQQPKGTKILIESFNGSESVEMDESNFIAFERDNDTRKGLENIVMLTVCKE